MCVEVIHLEKKSRKLILRVFRTTNIQHIIVREGVYLLYRVILLEPSKPKLFQDFDYILQLLVVLRVFTKREPTTFLR
jgi:hypothetical protein